MILKNSILFKPITKTLVKDANFRELGMMSDEFASFAVAKKITFWYDIAITVPINKKRVL